MSVVRAANPSILDEDEINLKPLSQKSNKQAARVRASDVERGKSGHFLKDIIHYDGTRHFTYEDVPIDKLLIDPRYQRALKQSFASKLAHNWNEDKNLPLIVSLRDNGNYYVLDGQQRHGALQMMENPPATVYAKVFRGLTLEQEADLFASGVTDRINITTGALFKSALVAGHPWAVGVDRAARAAGYMSVKDYPGVNNLTAIAAAREIYNRRGEFIITRILKVAHGAWPVAENSARSTILGGLEGIFVRYPTIDDERLTDVLRLTFDSPRDLEHSAHGYAKVLKKSIGVAMSYTIYEVYNKKLRSNKLPEWVW